MSSFTPNRNLPYPTLADTADVPRDIQALATALDGRGGSAGGGVLSASALLDVGQLGQIRAGRQLALADFTTLLGLSAPVGLYNLSDLTDASGNARTLTNKGTVPFGVGINGTAASTAVFSGSTAQALYIVDSGAADAFRIKTGSWGCWCRTSKRGQLQYMMGKSSTAAALGYFLSVTAANILQVQLSIDGATAPGVVGTTDIADGKWHFVTATFDGTTLRAYVDGMPEATGSGSLLTGPIFSSSGPFNVGGYAADSGTAATNPFYGSVDEAFVTADLLSDDQVRLLYCAKIAHSLGLTPTRSVLNVRRRRKGAAMVIGDFPSQPRRLYNLLGTTYTDLGVDNQALTPNPGSGTISPTAGPDGGGTGAVSFVGTTAGLSATDAGLPSLFASRSLGCWFKSAVAGNCGIVTFGGTTTSGTLDSRIILASGGIRSDSAADQIVGPQAADGLWHFVCVVEDNTAGDGLKRKLYFDGRLIGASTVLNSITLGGAGRMRVGACQDGTLPFLGLIARAFVFAGALTSEQQLTLFNKSGQQLGPSPKNEGDHLETFDAANVYATFDTLDAQHLIDLEVAA